MTHSDITAFNISVKSMQGTKEDRYLGYRLQGHINQSLPFRKVAGTGMNISWVSRVGPGTESKVQNSAPWERMGKIHYVKLARSERAKDIWLFLYPYLYVGT